MAGKKILTDEQIQEAKNMRKCGLTLQAIGIFFNISRACAKDIVTDYKYKKAFKNKKSQSKKNVT